MASSIIQTLNAAWEAANETYSRNEAISFKHVGTSPPPREKVVADSAATAAHKEAHFLHLAILYQRAANMADAVILAMHIASATDAGLVDGLGKEEAEAVEVATEALLTFLAGHPNAGEPLAGWGADIVRLSHERTDQRTGVPAPG